MPENNKSNVAIRLTISKKDSARTINNTIKKAVNHKKKMIDLDQYFGKVNFGKNGLDYQKNIRDEWQ